MPTAFSIKGLVATAALAAALAAGLGVGPALAEIKVAATTKPVHGLVAAVMDGIGEPALLLDGPASPHVTALRPSQARIIEDSKVVFAVGEGLEPFLDKLMEAGAGTSVVALAQAPGLELLGYRESEDHGDDHDDQDDDDDDHAYDDAGDHDHEAHDHGNVDPHVWLDPDNAKAMVEHIATVLIAADPDNAERYGDNAKATARELAEMKDMLSARLAPVKDRPFLVFHDAYQYFETGFGLNGLGAIVLNPETPPGARRLMEIRRRIGEAGVGCVFSEPQFEVGYVTTVLEGTGARTASLDPLGVQVEPGPDAYGRILSELTEAFVGCLEPQ